MSALNYKMLRRIKLYSIARRTGSDDLSGLYNIFITQKFYNNLQTNIIESDLHVNYNCQRVLLVRQRFQTVLNKGA